MDALERLTHLLAGNPLAAFLALSIAYIAWLVRKDGKREDRQLAWAEKTAAALERSTDALRESTEALERHPCFSRRPMDGDARAGVAEVESKGTKTGTG